MARKCDKQKHTDLICFLTKNKKFQLKQIQQLIDNLANSSKKFVQEK